MFPFIAAAFLVLSGILLWRTYHHNYKLPPGPMALPIIGNLQLLGNLPYRALHKLSKKYGPIMSISLGSVQAFVVSSPDTAKLFLGTHDAIFASRPNLEMSKYLSYGSKGIALAENGPYLWDVRKFCMVELLSDVKVSGFESMRRTEVGLMVREIKTASINQKVVNLSEIVGHLIEGMTCLMLFGKKGDERFDFKSLADEIMMAGVFNLADYVPMLAPFDIQGLTRHLKLLSNQIDSMLETLIHEHEQQTVTMSEKTQLDFIDIMLLKKYKDSNTQDKQFDRSSMKAILLDIMIGGIGTSKGSIEWLLSLLIKYPRVLQKLQKELSIVVGDRQSVSEIDLRKLKYLDMVVKETFRLYPVAPILGLHKSIKDVVINSYNIPKSSLVLVNFWSFGRDSSVWSENWEEFYPERFRDREVDLRGHDFSLIPFSSGRRACPGKNLGLISIGLVVANLVHCFNWKLPNDMSPNDLDMSEKFGFTMARAAPLLVVPTYRQEQTQIS